MKPPSAGRVQLGVLPQAKRYLGYQQVCRPNSGFDGQMAAAGAGFYGRRSL